MVYIGSISANRGIHQLLDLVTRLKTKNANIRLVLIGPFTDDQLENSARAYMFKAGIVENVQILGPMKNVDAYPVVARCMVGLALLLPEPNFAKSLPTKMFEYMALGLPVVVSNFPLWESIVRKHQVGAAVDPMDVGVVAEVIDELLVDQDRYRLLSRNARRAAQEYSWESENETLQRFVANVLGKH
jgi:glycosyltransferase involved in cell wall biosynthesis